jgi:hypothetical protein
MAFKRWLYQDGHPNSLAKLLNRGWANIHALGMIPNYVTLQVVGRQSGKVISFPLVMAVMNGEQRYLVSMLGEDANWVRNVKAADGRATLCCGTTENVRLEEVDAGQRAPILKKYLQVAPGARPHIPISKDAPVSEFERIAPQYPVFRVETVREQA